MREAFFDLETSSLNADYGLILCACIKPLGGKVEVYRLDKTEKEEPWDDSMLALDIANRLQEFDIICGYYSSRFDVPFLNSRLLFHRLDPLPPMKHVDLYYRIRYGLKIHSNSLDAAARFLENKTDKTRIEGKYWVKALMGDTRSLDYIVDHCTTPDARALTRDLRWVPVGDLHTGDELVGFEEEPSSAWPLSGGRRYRTATVTHIAEARAPVYAVELSTGEVLRTTADHRWLVGVGRGKGWHWVTTDHLRTKEQHGDFATKVRRVLPLFSPARDFESGWLSGLIDGEGTFGKHYEVSIAQRPGAVLEKAKVAIRTLGRDYSLHPVQSAASGGLGRKDCQVVHIRGALPDRLALLGSLRPERLVTALDPDHFGRMERRSEESAEVLRIRPDGKQEITKVETSTGTLFIEGYPMHNCKKDVVVLEETYERVKGTIRTILTR